MLNIRVLLLLCVVVFTGCADKLAEVCGSSPGTGATQCCAVGTLDIENNFQAQNFSCEPSNAQCKSEAVSSAYPAHRFPFIPDADYQGNNAFEGGCAPVSWAEQNAFSPPFSGVEFAQLENSLAFVPVDEPLNCMARCNYDFPNGGGGNPALCPGININPGVASALFFFYSDIDPQKYPEDEQVVPIREILARFSVPEEDLAACPRQDVTVYADGRVVNEGEACPTYSSFSVQGQDIESQLGISEKILGNFSSQGQNDALMTYPNTDETFELAHDQAIYDALYGGKIRKSGRLYDSAVVEILNRQDLKTCARANSQFELTNEEQFLLRDAPEEEVIRLINSVLEVLEPDLKADGLPGPKQKFRPVYTALENLSSEQLNDLKARIGNLPLDFDGIDQAGLLIPLVRWLDASICNSALFADGQIQFEYADGYRAELLLGGDFEARELASREFLRCVSVDGFASDAFSAAVVSISGEQL